MKLDFASYKHKNEHGAVLDPLDMGLNKDLAEKSMSSTYDPESGIPEEEDNNIEDGI